MEERGEFGPILGNKTFAALYSTEGIIMAALGIRLHPLLSNLRLFFRLYHCFSQSFLLLCFLFFSFYNLLQGKSTDFLPPIPRKLISK